MSTFKDVVDSFNLARTFPEHYGSRAPRPITERERSLHPPLETVLFDDDWLESLVTTLRETYDQQPLTPPSIQRIRLLEMNEEVVVEASWTREQSQVEGFLNILRTAAVVVEDLLQLPRDSVRAGGEVSHEACVPDLHARDEKDVVLLTVEAKTPDVLNQEDWDFIAEKATQGVSWSEGEFVLQHAGSMIIQTWCQSVYESYDNDNGQTVTPRYCGLTNYNETLLGLRGSGTDFTADDENTLFLAGPFNRNETFIGLVAILLKQVTVKMKSNVHRARAAVHKLPHPNKDAKDRRSELADLKLDKRHLEFNPQELTFNYDIRKRSGLPFMCTAEPKIIRRGKRPETAVTRPSTLPLSPASSGSQSPLGSPDPSDPSTRHLTITAHLGDGVVGEVYLAKCGEALLVWKEVDPTKEAAQNGDSAWREAALYEGQLATLQGTVVPRFYGAYHKTTDDHVVLLMEYVGRRLSAERWGEVPPAVRAAAEEQLAKVAAAGVFHGDFEPRNICIADAGDIRIIDFSHSNLM
ncbi:hypothetical protein FB451DRAFT_1554878 [Mycena latifolia]|nr:hypothetical protein FB451DRAFT_1554878 [Mycena latifolia]